MYLEHLVPKWISVISAPNCFINRVLNPHMVSFGLLANLDYLSKRGVFEGVDCVVDIGANIGQFAFMIQAILPKIQVFSFEPDSESFAKLEDNFEKYKIKGKCFSLALSNQVGEEMLNVYESSANNSLLPRVGESPSAVKTVNCNTLDLVSKSFGQVNSAFLKIDVQGAELLVLGGSKEFLGKCKFVQVEVSLSTAYTGNALIEDVIATMRSSGFVCWEILDVLRKKAPEDLGILEMDLLFRRLDDITF